MSLFARLRAGSQSAALISYKYIKLRSGLPDDLDSLQNARDVVAENPGFRLIQGWLSSQDGILEKHVIIENTATGDRFDVTPRERRVPFFEHPGTMEEFEGLWHQISLPAYSPAVRLVVQEVELESHRGSLASDMGPSGENADA